MAMEINTVSDEVTKELNLEYLQEVSGGDEEFEQDILDTFLETAPDLLEALQSAIAASDAAALRHASHTLKGSSRSIGGQPFSKICEAIEAFAKQGDVDSALPIVPELFASYERLKVACQAHIDAAIAKAA